MLQARFHPAVKCTQKFKITFITNQLGIHKILPSNMANRAIHEDLDVKIDILWKDWLHSSR